MQPDSPESVQALPVERVERRILILRGHKVLLDKDLAELYGVNTKSLLQAYRRNPGRFPPDFAFVLEPHEVTLRSQTVTSKGRGGRRYPSVAFTEQGVAMLSSVLHTERAILVNVAIMRAFVRLRGILASHKELAGKLEELEQRYDAQFRVVFDAIRELMKEEPGEGAKKRIDFGSEQESVAS